MDCGKDRVMDAWNRNQMPQEGYVLAYFRDGAAFEAYDSRTELDEKLNRWRERTVLEFHAFNEEKEWRWLTSRRAGSIQAILTDEGKDTFTENVFVIPSFCHVMRTLQIINYLDYDENDMLFVKGYRLAPGKETN